MPKSELITAARLRKMVKQMGETPLIMALANPTPEIEPGAALAARPDAMICTGRSDYPNQVNNVLRFPYMFRGALDVAASTINEAMKLAAVRAIAQLAHEPPSDVVAKAYGGEARQYGKDSLIPSPFDPRLILCIAPAVAKAAMETGVAKKPITDFAAYEETLSRFVFRSGFIMKPLMQAAKANPKRVYRHGMDRMHAASLSGTSLADGGAVANAGAAAHRCSRIQVNELAAPAC